MQHIVRHLDLFNNLILGLYLYGVNPAHEMCDPLTKSKTTARSHFIFEVARHIFNTSPPMCNSLLCSVVDSSVL